MGGDHGITLPGAENPGSHTSERTAGRIGADMPFEPIETQEDFDRAIKPRLDRERAKVMEQYADYDALK